MSIVEILYFFLEKRDLETWKRRLLDAVFNHCDRIDDQLFFLYFSRPKTWNTALINIDLSGDIFRIQVKN